MAGRPPHDPTPEQRKQVETYSAYGVKVEDIARALGVSIPTLRKHYTEELYNGAMQANAAVAQNMYRLATSQSVSEKVQADAGKFWLARRAGWKEEVDHRLGGIPDGSPIKVEVSDDFERFAELLDEVVRLRVGGDEEADGVGPSGEG